jgi:MarR family 2-MHQ and catechol resistance regulon transcriptional repressor
VEEQMTQDRSGAASVERAGDVVRDGGYARATAKQYHQAFPAVDALAVEISLGVHVAHSAAQEARTRVVNSFGLGRVGGRYSALRSLYLASENYLTPQELSERLMITAASVTFLIDGLEKDGLVVRTVDEHDRRSRQIGLTEKGREVCEDLIPAVGELVGRFCHGFTDDEKRQFADYLVRFWQNANAETGR